MIDFFSHLIHEFEFPLKNPVLIFSLVLLIILLSPILLRKVNVPGLIGLIVSGVIIGPFGLNILEKSSAVELFSTIGLLYIMFIAGLELDMNEFRANRYKSLIFGFLTFVIPMGVGYPVCFYLLGYDLNASMLTAAMFATHTLVAYPIVSKLGVSKNQAVAITVGGTILADTAVLIILAIIIGNHEGNISQDFFIRLGVSLIFFSLIMFLVIPRIAKWFFSNLESEKHSHYIFVLAVVFFAAFLAEVAGVEAIIGAFVAGLALNRLIPHSSALMNRIEFIGNSLFIPFFLISVGMMVDITVIFSEKMAVIVAVTLSIVGLFGKWLAALFTQWIFKYSRAQRQLIFGLSSARVAATLAVILVGYKAGILDENILNATIILILITSIVASFATEKAAKIIAVREAEDPAEKESLFNNEHILLPIEDVANIKKLLEFAILIKEAKSPNPISVLSVVSNNQEAEINLLKARKKMEELVKQGSAADKKVNIITTIDHNVASGIARISREVLANIIVLGWPHRSGIIDKLIGEKVDSVLNNTDKTTFICHIDKPLVLHKRIFMLVPPLAERESGFGLWLHKAAKLALELSIPLTVHCNSITEEAIQSFLKSKKLSVDIVYRYFDDWEDFKSLTKQIYKDDLMILVAARKGAISHMNVLEHLPTRIEKLCGHVSRLVVYPQSYTQDQISNAYEEISAPSLKRRIFNLAKIGK